MKWQQYIQYYTRNIIDKAPLFCPTRDMILSRNDSDIPRIYLSDLLNECIQTMQIARAAVIYLILMVDWLIKNNLVTIQVYSYY